MTINKKINKARELVKQYCFNKNLVANLFAIRRDELKKEKRSQHKQCIDKSKNPNKNNMY